MQKKGERQDRPMEHQELPPNRRRRHRTRAEILKEAYLPYLFPLAAAVLILLLIIGAMVRGG